MKMKELSPALRPYEKCMKYGPEFLADEELLAVIIRCGNRDEDSVSLARRILSLEKPQDGILNIMSLSVKKLMSIKGIGMVKAIQIKCIAELSKRIAMRSHEDNDIFTSAKSIADYYMEQMRHLKRECFMALFLDSACKYIGEYEISLGTVNSSIASPREVFIEAMRQEAVNVVLVHNHPSGNPTPSNEDISLTISMMKAGQMLGIHVIDHIVIGDNKYISLREKGIIQEDKS